MVFDNSVPIYLQLIDYFKTSIITGKYKSGERLPSVREFSQELQVNPNTIQRALIELENIGLIKTMRTNGKYVTDDEKNIEKVKKQLIEEIMNDFISKFDTFHISNQELIDFIKNNRKGK